jgi:ribosomal-protein-alanine N-acetyltransferase
MAAKIPLVDPKYLSLLWAAPERAHEIAILHAQLFDPPWDEAGIKRLLEHPASTSLIAQAGQPRALAGFVIGQLVADEGEILSLGVVPAWQRLGIGKRLVEGLARAAKRAEAKRLFLEVAADNDGALALYRQIGFAETGRRKGYYDRANGLKVDAVTMALMIDP